MLSSRALLSHAFLASTAFAVAIVGCADPVPVEVVEVKRENVLVSEGGTVTSPSGTISVDFPPRSFTGDTEITMVESSSADIGNAALSTRLLISSSVDGVIGFSAVLRFDDVSELDSIAPANLVVGVGKQPFEEIIDATVVSDGTVEAEISDLGSFVLVDKGVLEGTPEPEGEPEGGPDTFGQCSESCLSASDQPCCLTCGGCAADACVPVCPSGTDWDCELSCCFDYEATTCADI